MAKIREKQLQKRMQETLEVALRILMERGYANLNMDELAEEVGISKPTLYQYFNSKDELVAQAFALMFQKMEEHILELAEMPALDQLEQFLRAMLKSRSLQRAIMTQVDMETMRSIFHRYPFMIERLVSARNKISEIVTKAQEQGEIDPSLPAWVVVNALFSLQGVVSSPFMKEEIPRSDEEIARAIESTVRLFRRGVSVEATIQTSILS